MQMPIFYVFFTEADMLSSLNSVMKSSENDSCNSLLCNHFVRVFPEQCGITNLRISSATVKYALICLYSDPVRY